MLTRNQINLYSGERLECLWSCTLIQHICQSTLAHHWRISLLPLWLLWVDFKSHLVSCGRTERWTAIDCTTLYWLIWSLHNSGFLFSPLVLRNYFLNTYCMNFSHTFSIKFLKVSYLIMKPTWECKAHLDMFKDAGYLLHISELLDNKMII